MESEIIKLDKAFIRICEDVLSAIVLSDVFNCFFNNETGFLLKRGDKDWVGKSNFNWEENLAASRKTIDSRIKKLKNKKLIETKLIKINNAPLLHLRINTDNPFYFNYLKSKELCCADANTPERRAGDMFFPSKDFAFLTKSNPSDFILREKSYNSSRSIYTPTEANKEISAKSFSKDDRLSLLNEIEKLELPWIEKERLLKGVFNSSEILILKHLDGCPINTDQKSQLFCFEPEDVLQAVRRTKQSKIKKTFMHCLMHACIHKLGPYPSDEKLEEELSFEKESEIQKNKELALLLQRLVEGTNLQGCIKANEYHIYYNLNHFYKGKNVVQNVSYLDKKFKSVVKGLYKLCISKISSGDKKLNSSYTSLSDEEIKNNTNQTKKEKKYSGNFRVCV